MLILTNELHWKLILTNRIPFLQQLDFETYYMFVSILAEGGPVGSKIQFLPFGAYRGGNRPNKTKRIVIITLKEMRKGEGEWEGQQEGAILEAWPKEKGLSEKRAFWVKTGKKCQGAGRRNSSGCLRHRNKPAHGSSLVKQGEREEKWDWWVGKDQNKPWRSWDFLFQFH